MLTRTVDDLIRALRPTLGDPPQTLRQLARNATTETEPATFQSSIQQPAGAPHTECRPGPVSSRP